MPATASSTVRKRRLSSADRRIRGAALSSPITSANYGIAVSPSGGFAATSPFHGEEFSNPTGFPTQLKRNEAAPAADTASTGKPPGDTLLVSAPLYGRCLLVEANLCADCRWTRTENELLPQCNDPMPLSRPLALFASTTFEVGEPRPLGERLVRECRGER